PFPDANPSRSLRRPTGTGHRRSTHRKALFVRITEHPRFAAALAATAALTLGLTACGTDSDPSSGGGGGDEADASGPLTVAATPVPQAEILEFVRDNLAEDAGLDLRIQEFTDYVLPNTAL